MSLTTYREYGGEKAGLLPAADPGVSVQHRPHQGRPGPDITPSITEARDRCTRTSVQDASGKYRDWGLGIKPVIPWGQTSPPIGVNHAVTWAQTNRPVGDQPHNTLGSNQLSSWGSTPP